MSFEHYRCQLVIPADTREINVFDTVEFLHPFITTPTLTPEDCILHGINTLSSAIQNRPTATYEAQIQDIKKLRDICTGWTGIHTPQKSQVQEQTRPCCRSPRVEKFQQPQKSQQPPRVPENNNLPKHNPRVHIQDQVPAPAPRVNPKKKPDQEPVGRCTRSQYQTTEHPTAKRTRSQLNQALTVTQAQAAQRKTPKESLALWCTPKHHWNIWPCQSWIQTLVTPWNTANCAGIPMIKNYGRNHTAMNLAVSAKAQAKGITDKKNNASPEQKHSR